MAKRPLTRGRILRAAFALIDRDGLDALSMRRLGAALGVEAMALYRHV
jgi:TetR/AcrR family tetracycline transcriptional repressor